MNIGHIWPAWRGLNERKKRKMEKKEFITVGMFTSDQRRCKNELAFLMQHEICFILFDKSMKLLTWAYKPWNLLLNN